MQTTLQSLAAPVGRLFLSSIFIMSGIQKITAYEGTQGYMEMMGVSGGLLPLVILTELVGGFALLAGYQARIAAFLLAGFSILSGFLFHFLPAQGMEGMAAQMEMIMFMKNVSIAGGLLMIVSLGSGDYSVRNRNSMAAVPAE